MVSYLYGVRYDITAIIELCNKYGVIVVEDIAEDYRGPKENGHPDAALSLFSFGTIKIDTGLGGGVGVIRRNEPLYLKMKKGSDAYPVVPNSL